MAVAIRAILDALGDSAVRRLKRERSRGFADAVHRMRFPRSLGFTGATELQRGEVFPRAIIADALCDAINSGDARDDGLVEDDCAFFAEQRLQYPYGGWSYFPELPELPADTDVLAQVLQVLVRAHPELDVPALLEEPIDILLRDRLRPNGAVGTWILPATPSNDIEKRQTAYVATHWGDTDDVEVVANFVYALSLYDAVQFRTTIKRGRDFITQAQATDGSWSSTWYAGPYYGTYVCVRALAADSGSATALAGARRFLETRRRDDGGWGRGLLPHQLHTALALCTLAQVADSGYGQDADVRQIDEGIQALGLSVTASQGWQPAPFIQMNVGRARGAPGPMLYYGSGAITAAYGLKAACEARRILGAFAH